MKVERERKREGSNPRLIRYRCRSVDPASLSRDCTPIFIIKETLRSFSGEKKITRPCINEGKVGPLWIFTYNNILYTV